MSSEAQICLEQPLSNFDVVRDKVINFYFVIKLDTLNNDSKRKVGPPQFYISSKRARNV